MTQQSTKAVEDIFMKTASVTMPRSVTQATAHLGFLERIRDLFMKFVKYITKGKNWRSSPKLWIGAFIAYRILLAFCREYGLTFFKKDLSKEHVYLTGAGSGIGRLMAQRLGAMGAKLSISDINLQGVEETK